MLEEPDKIDLVIGSPDGPLLVITDSGMTSNEDDRLSLFQQKLASYATYIGSEDFRSQFPNWHHATIRLTAARPVTDAMAAIESLEIKTAEQTSVTVPVTFEVMENPYL